MLIQVFSPFRPTDWQLWFHEQLPAGLAERKEHVSAAQSLDAASIERFCQIIGNQSVEFKQGQAPLDFAIVAGWGGIMQALMASCDADLLSLVHLSNSFKMVDGAAPLRAGDVCSASASVKSVKISDTGKTVAVSGVVLRKEGDQFKPAIRVVSSFFFRGRFTDFSTCFESSQEDYSIDIKTKADASVLMSKEWFQWTAATPLEPGTTLHFDVQSELRYKDSSSFSAVEVQGEAYIVDYKDDRIPVGAIAYSADSISYGNPVSLLRNSFSAFRHRICDLTWFNPSFARSSNTSSALVETPTVPCLLRTAIRLGPQIRQLNSPRQPPTSPTLRPAVTSTRST